MRSSIAIDIWASPDLVFALASDVERWPRLLPHYVAVTPLARSDEGVTARFVARRPLLPWLGLGIPVAWRARAWSEPDARRLRFRHLGGATAGMDVTWRIEPVGTPAASRCRVEIEHDFGPRVPGWAAVVDRAFVRPIASRTLATFRAIAEAATEAAIEPGGQP